MIDAQLLVLVACGARKAGGQRPAAELYTGPYMRMCLTAARALVADDAIRIVSARHGLVPLSRVLAPYDTRLGDPRAVTGAVLRRQAAAAGLLERAVFVFGGAGYVALAQAVWPEARAPLVGGIGYQRQQLARIIATGTVPGVP